MVIDNQFLDKVSEQAKESPRLRMNYNFHQSLYEKCHRFLNAVEPGTEVPIDLWSTSDATRPSLSKLRWRSLLPRFISIPQRMRRL